MAKTKRNKSNTLKNLKDKAEEKLDSTKEQIEEAKEKTEDIIKKNPFASIAIAAAIGAAVALGVNALVRREKPLLRRFRDYF